MNSKRRCLWHYDKLSVPNLKRSSLVKWVVHCNRNRPLFSKGLILEVVFWEVRHSIGEGRVDVYVYFGIGLSFGLRNVPKVFMLLLTAFKEFIALMKTDRCWGSVIVLLWNSSRRIERKQVLFSHVHHSSSSLRWIVIVILIYSGLIVCLSQLQSLLSRGCCWHRSQTWWVITRDNVWVLSGSKILLLHLNLGSPLQVYQVIQLVFIC